MGTAFLVVASVLFGLLGTAEAQALESATTFNRMFPLPSSQSLSETELVGKKLFLQTCSTCHLPGLPIFEAYAPILDSELISMRGEEYFRKYVMHGSRQDARISVQPAAS